MEDTFQPITSFVIRCTCVDVQEITGEKVWRIKVKHVQGEEEIAVQSLDDMMVYMKRVLGE
ncbi:hypothetical protein [Bacillus suaedaesalsae]|uniref:Uncharacterized protein n=1 Tax=Bacillus suaedaesalsae TaxID=2810349 RepID=A0ABS2DFA9_9BACI|nr:hypothetical protein [Bacillus suaedaesalsae]MBM6617150.1 hypothetical protein [Bacillus suaedaesalsae]